MAYNENPDPLTGKGKRHVLASIVSSLAMTKSYIEPDREASIVLPHFKMIQKIMSDDFDMFYSNEPTMQWAIMKNNLVDDVAFKLDFKGNDWASNREDLTDYLANFFSIDDVVNALGLKFGDKIDARGNPIIINAALKSASKSKEESYIKKLLLNAKIIDEEEESASYGNIMVARKALWRYAKDDTKNSIEDGKTILTSNGLKFMQTINDKTTVQWKAVINLNISLVVTTEKYKKAYITWYYWSYGGLDAKSSPDVDHESHNTKDAAERTALRFMMNAKLTDYKEFPDNTQKEIEKYLKRT